MRYTTLQMQCSSTSCSTLALLPQLQSNMHLLVN
jgi:hypothetical protein